MGDSLPFPISKRHKKLHSNSKHLVKELPIRRAKHLDISDKFDCVFWAGDLNFRLEEGIFDHSEVK